MYNIDERKEISGITIKELINILNTLPQNAKVVCCGDDCVWLHVEKDKSIVCIDTEDLEDCYEV